MEQVQRKLNESRLLRWLVLIFTAGLMFGTYWAEDCLGPLKGMFETELGFTSSEFGRLAQASTWLNLFGMIIIGGIILDRWGIRKAGTLFSFLATAGAFLIYLGSKGTFGQSKNAMLWTMIIGRILFGSGLETVCVMVSRTIVKWFKGYELALAMAISVGFGRLGSTGAVSFGAEIAGGGVAPGLSFAAAMIGVGFLMFIVYIFFDFKFDKVAGASAPAGSLQEEQFKLSDLPKLVTDRSFIFITLLCVAFYVAVFPFIKYGPDFLYHTYKFGYTLPALKGLNFLGKIKAYLQTGPKVTALIPLATLLFTPIFGWFVDKKGKAASVMILGSLLIIFAHFIFSFLGTVALGYIGLVCLGIAFSLVPAAMWPSVPKIVPDRYLGTAYATMFTIQNWGLNLFYWGIGWLVDWANPEAVKAVQAAREDLLSSGVRPEDISQKIEVMRQAGELPYYDYTIPVLPMLVMAVVSILLAFKLKASDKKQGYGLELPSGSNLKE